MLNKKIVFYDFFFFWKYLKNKRLHVTTKTSFPYLFWLNKLYKYCFASNPFQGKRSEKQWQILINISSRTSIILNKKVI